MKQRCQNVNAPHYADYGERGIKICPEWIESFEAFVRDAGVRPGKQYSLDRINNEGNYEPGNVKWSTRKEQNRNKRTNVHIEWKGKMYLLTDLAKEVGIDQKLLRTRLFVCNMPVEQAVERMYFKTTHKNAHKKFS